ncbi:hypothetical protein U1Q18_012862 [Sarracenia purpurea var. burkii]
MINEDVLELAHAQDILKDHNEPSNAILVKFLSYISEHLADSADVVLNRLLLHSRKQNELLPLRVFNNLNSSLMYGKLQYQDTGYIDIDDDDCIAGILLKRAFNKFEFDDVRKLAAELCGRIHPQVLFPIIASQLEHAANAYDVMKLKACLFSVCTSLVVRGRDSILHPSVLKIRNTIEIVLLWPSLDRDEVSKAQHGCIDCLALMICTELQEPESFRDLSSTKKSLTGMDCSPDATVRNSIVCYVIDQLTRDKYRIVCSSTMANDGMHEASLSLSFRLCMANVLISACQKISDPGKKPFAQKILPHLIQSIWVVTQSEIRAACVEVFFSAVYHLKSFILPYASDLLKISLKTLREGSEKEKLAGAKLMASLMASEEKVVESIAGGLLEARTLLSGISSSDPSHKVRQVCKQLLACLTSP